MYLLDLISSVGGDDKVEVTNVLNHLFSLDLSKLTIEDAQAQISNYIAILESILGQETAKAFQAILSSIRQVSDADAGITSQSLFQYEKACKALNVSLRETKNGIQSLRDPVEVLEELSEACQKLGENDIRKKNLLNSVGSDASASQLDALLSSWDTYEKMLEEYGNGTGSLAADAEMKVTSLEGSLNRLGNTWNETVDNALDSKSLTGAVNALNTLLGAVNKLTDALGSPGTLGMIGGILGAKNVGSPEMSGLKNKYSSVVKYADHHRCSSGYGSFPVVLGAVH